jgi:hypothetical protein
MWRIQPHCGKHPSSEWIEFRFVSPCQVLNRMLTSTPHACCRWQGPGPFKISWGSRSLEGKNSKDFVLPFLLVDIKYRVTLKQPPFLEAPQPPSRIPHQPRSPPKAHRIELCLKKRRRAHCSVVLSSEALCLSIQYNCFCLLVALLAQEQQPLDLPAGLISKILSQPIVSSAGEISRRDNPRNS